MNAPTHAEILIGRRSANQALLESRLGECVNMLNVFIRRCEPGALVEEAYAVASRSSDALRTIREGDAL